MAAAVQKGETFSDTASSGVTSACDHFLHVSSTYPTHGDNRIGGIIVVV
jgi:hypothetical protein